MVPPPPTFFATKPSGMLSLFCRARFPFVHHALPHSFFSFNLLCWVRCLMQSTSLHSPSRVIRKYEGFESGRSTCYPLLPSQYAECVPIPMFDVFPLNPSNTRCQAPPPFNSAGSVSELDLELFFPLPSFFHNLPPLQESPKKSPLLAYSLVSSRKCRESAQCGP